MASAITHFIVGAALALPGVRFTRLGGVLPSWAIPATAGLLGVKAVLHKQLLVNPQPALLIRHLKVFNGRKQFNLMTHRIQVPQTSGPKRSIDPIHAPFPGGMEDRLVIFVLNGAHILQATHIVNAVHAFAPSGGTLETPTMALRVTRAASSSSLRFSVPFGRSGSTM
jgi:hypothetical protein